MSQLDLSAPALIGDSPRMREIRALVHKLGQRNSPVLILGETGTGKEVVARAIHAAGTSGAFIPIDCSTLGNLLEAELFGHTKGAFTGAIAAKAGLLEVANGGTAFFDEVGEIPIDMQAKLLRVLQDHEVRPLGSVSRRRTDFRPIAATNRDLAAEIERGRFRSDLYYRLNVVTLRLPPLRDRREDIPALAQHFLARYGQDHELAPDLLHSMMKYDWPGNVRQLENAIQRMTALNSGPLLHSEDLPSVLQTAAFRAQASAASTGSVAPPRDRVLPLEDLERQAIQEALAITRGDRSRAAAMLQIGRTTLYRKLKSYGML